MPGTELSRAKVVEKLVNDSHSSLNTIEATNENQRHRQKI